MKIVDGILEDSDDVRVEGIFEFRSHPISEPHVMKLRRGWAELVFNNWYVVIDNGSRVDEDGQWRREWGYGLSWFHPDPEVQPPCTGTFDQMLVPVDDAAKRIVQFVKEGGKTP